MPKFLARCTGVLRSKPEDLPACLVKVLVFEFSNDHFLGADAQISLKKTSRTSPIVLSLCKNQVRLLEQAFL